MTKKPSYEDFSKDLKDLAIKARRAGYANKYLAEESATVEFDVFEKSAIAFADKYNTTIRDTQIMAIGIAETIDLGLAY